MCHQLPLGARHSCAQSWSTQEKARLWPTRPSKSVANVRAQVLLGLRDRDAAATGVVLYLVLADAGDTEILRLRMGEVVARHGCVLVHREALGECLVGFLVCVVLV